MVDKQTLLRVYDYFIENPERNQIVVTSQPIPGCVKLADGVYATADYSNRTIDTCDDPVLAHCYCNMQYGMLVDGVEIDLRAVA